MKPCRKPNYCLEHNSWLCGWEEDKAEFNGHMAALDAALKTLDKHRHGR